MGLQSHDEALAQPRAHAHLSEGPRMNINTHAHEKHFPPPTPAPPKTFLVLRGKATSEVSVGGVRPKILVSQEDCETN